MTAGDALIPERYCSGAQEVRREIKRGSKGPATSRCGREDVIPVRFSLDFAVGRGPSLDQHTRKAELSQGMCEEVQVTDEPAGGEQQTRQALARDGQQGAGTKADDGGRYEAEHRGKGAETGRGKDLSHGR